MNKCLFAIIEDNETGMTHEWQIGTKAITEVFEREGIKIPDGLKLKQRMHPDLHDIEYDIFAQVQIKYPELAEEFGIPKFRKDLDILAGKAGNLGEAYKKNELYEEIEKFHKIASDILQNLYDKKGAKFIEGFYH